MARMGRSVAPEAAGSTAPATAARGSGKPAKAARGSDLQGRHDRWASERSPKAADEPRSDNFMDLFKTGIQAAQTQVTADVEVASRDGRTSAHLHGDGRGTGGAAGIVQLAATDLHAQTAGGTLDATNVDTGAIQVAAKGTQTNVQLSGFTIQTLHWLGT